MEKGRNPPHFVLSLQQNSPCNHSHALGSLSAAAHQAPPAATAEWHFQALLIYFWFCWFS